MIDAEANLWEVFLGYVDILNATQSILITVIFAFLIAIYFAGAKFTRMQLVLIVGIYSVYYVNQVWVLMVQYQRSVEFAREIEQLNPARHLAINIEVALLFEQIYNLVFEYKILYIFPHM